MKPDTINILGKDYKIAYCDNPADVDIHKRSSLWGQFDPWTRTIRVYDNGRTPGDILHTILHEVLHAITYELNMKWITDSSEEENTVDLLSLALADILTRNDWLKKGE